MLNLLTRTVDVDGYHVTVHPSSLIEAGRMFSMSPEEILELAKTKNMIIVR